MQAINAHQSAENWTPNWGGFYRVTRLLLLFSFFCGALILHRWSVDGDPRFFAFLNSPIGQRVGVTFGWWSSPLDVPIIEKSFARYTRSERAAHRELTEAWPAGPGKVMYRDVRFRMEFPEMAPLLEPPYLVMSDAPEEEAKLLVAELLNLHEEFNGVFGSLAARAPSDATIHVLYFSDFADYLAYQASASHGLEETSGFYSPSANRLVLYRSGEMMTSARGTPRLPPALLATVRHEGAHQLFYDYGVHSAHRAEHDWLIEGLATYCEEARIGAVSVHRLAILHAALATHREIPLAQLITSKSPEGLLAHRATELAYSQSWGLVHLLMTEPYREDFFRYIRQVRDPAEFQVVRRTPPMELLCNHLNLTPDELDARLRQHVEALAGWRL